VNAVIVRSVVHSAQQHPIPGRPDVAEQRCVEALIIGDDRESIRDVVLDHQRHAARRPIRQGCSLRLRDHTEQVALGVSEDYVLGSLGIHPVHPPGAERDEPLDLGPQVGVPVHPEVQVHRVAPVHV
jgi:hypothetical protein